MIPPVIGDHGDRQAWSRILTGPSPGPEDLKMSSMPWETGVLRAGSVVRALEADDRCGQFRCGDDQYDRWLTSQHRTGIGPGHSSSTVVLVNDKKRVLAYYSWMAGSVIDLEGTGPDDDIPAAMLSHLAVDRRYRRTGIGRGLLLDALLRTERLSSEIGCTGLVIDCGPRKDFVLRSVPWASDVPHSEHSVFVRVRPLR